jgi:hypothetical protein
MKKVAPADKLFFRIIKLDTMIMFVLLFSFIILPNRTEAQSLYVTTGGTVPAQNTAVNIAGNAIVSNGATPLVGATVSVSSNFVTGQDVLGLNGAASGGISSSYNATTGVLTLSGSATAADYQATLQKVTYTNTSATPNTSARVITFSLNAALPFSGTGHFYEFVTNAGISWPDANTAANARKYFGLQGYLVTVMSAEENAFCAAKLVGDGWMGANAESDGETWIWATGPEAGTVFWNGVNYGTGVSGKYANWATNQPDGIPHTEDYVQFYASGGHGKWNNLPVDYDPLINGYVVEYGGTTGDPIIHISDFVTVDFAPRVSNLTTTTGTAIKWYDAPTDGNLLPSTTLLVGGNHYYASQTVNGIESTSRLDVVATLNLTSPSPSSHTASPAQIVWNWATVSGATGYKWSTTNVYTSATDIPSGTTKTETGLTCNNQYTRYVWAYNTTTSCVSKPALLTQTTSSCVALPSVSTLAVTNIGATTATFNGNISAINGANVTTRGFKYSTTSGFDPVSTGTNISESGTYGIDAFSISTSGITSTTTYYVRAHATNSAGTTYGDQVSFTTIVYTVWTFTNAGATGNTGPTQTQINSTYSGTSLAGGVAINTQGIQEWTVPVTGTYRINAKGAGGGANYYTQRVRGGYGASMSGDFALTAGQVLKIAIGQRGLDGTIDNFEGSSLPQEVGGSAGGGSFVTFSNNTPLIVAGGGGGATTRLSYAGAIGGDGLTGTDGGSGTTASPGAGGTGGSGGGGCSNPGFQGGSGGGGHTGNGGNSQGSNSYGSINYGGSSFVNNAAGGVKGTSESVGALRDGGFGGGGCGGYTGGGGGGYSGGGAGGDGGSGGGGSYNAGTNQTNTAGSNSGHGQVIITKL